MLLHWLAMGFLAENSSEPDPPSEGGGGTYTTIARHPTPQQIIDVQRDQQARALLEQNNEALVALLA